jgi:hypothetical protein
MTQLEDDNLKLMRFIENDNVKTKDLERAADKK